MDPTPEPQTLTVEEAARILRIGRTAAYALAREWRTTHGRSGLPVLELGRPLRVPHAALAHLLGAPTAGVVVADDRPPTPRLTKDVATPSKRTPPGGSQGVLWEEPDGPL